MTLRRVVFKYLDTLRARKIIVAKLVYHISKIMQREVSRDSVLRCARDYADITGGLFEVIDSRRGIYWFAPGFGIGDAKLEGRE